VGEEGLRHLPPVLCRQYNLVHVLNLCQVALNLRCYNDRHDSVLTVLYATILQHLPEFVSSTVDLAKRYVFPSHIVSTDLRPDIVWWSDKDQSVCLVELTVCYDTLFHEAATWKTDKYLDLLSAIRNAGYNAKLITIEVGSGGLPNMSWFESLRKELKLMKTQTHDLVVQAAGEQCWAHLVYGAVETKLISSFCK